MKSRHLRLPIALFIVCVFSIQTAFSQRYCGATQYNQVLTQDSSVLNKQISISLFTDSMISDNKSALNAPRQKDIIIPVVFHVVYNWPEQNIPDNLLHAQIEQLNLDFARQNTDRQNTPVAFATKAKAAGIKFVLANIDPYGLQTNGIVRVKTKVDTFMNATDLVKFSYAGGSNAWPTSDYLNIWICNLKRDYGYSPYPGGPIGSDGVVVDYRTVGSMLVNAPTAYVKYGRTTTHEVGHWLNLIHLWGDGDSTRCGDDFVADTPKQEIYNEGYPQFPRITECQGISNAPNGDMFTNYMDYAEDSCMNMFTEGQVDRMRALFVLGGYRYSITKTRGYKK